MVSRLTLVSLLLLRVIAWHRVFPTPEADFFPFGQVYIENSAKVSTGAFLICPLLKNL